MKNFKILLKSDVSKIKSLFINSIEEMDVFSNFSADFFSLKYNRKFVGNCDGLNLKLSVTHFHSYFRSPILKGKIEELDDNIKAINFKLHLHPVYILSLTLIFIFAAFLFNEIFKSENTLFILSIVFIILCAIAYELYNFLTKLGELKYFINKIFRDLVVE